MYSNQLVAIENYSNATSVVAVVLAIWLALVFLPGAGGAFVRPPGTPPFPIVIGVAVPIIFFLAAFWWLRAFREFVLAFDLHLLTGIQAWRFAGLGFLAKKMRWLRPAGASAR